MKHASMLKRAKVEARRQRAHRWHRVELNSLLVTRAAEVSVRLAVVAARDQRRVEVEEHAVLIKHAEKPTHVFRSLFVLVIRGRHLRRT